MPIRARIDMTSTGIRTPLGIKLYGPDLAKLEPLARRIETAVKSVPGASSVFAERVTGAYYLDIDPDRAALARYGLTIADIQSVITTALGGEAVTNTVEGRERYSVNLRYPRAFRSDPQAIAEQVLVPAGAAMVPLGQLVKISLLKGPPVIRTENARLAVYIYVDIQGRDIGGFVSDAQKVIARDVPLPSGVSLQWSGQFEYLERAKQRLALVVPVTLLIVFMLLYLNFRRLTETLIVMLSLPFSLVGGLWLLYALGFNMSVAVAVGFIALAGVAAQTGVVMLIYLDQALNAARDKCHMENRIFGRADLYRAVMDGAVERVRPKMMTVTAIMAGLLPILWNHGTGSEVMQRIAVPMLGGMISSTILTLVVIPALYAAVKQREI
jgi:Cu(I)/Ag(I) efflux system membrane protein CusA/SilA